MIMAEISYSEDRHRERERMCKEFREYLITVHLNISYAYRTHINGTVDGSQNHATNNNTTTIHSQIQSQTQTHIQLEFIAFLLHHATIRVYVSVFVHKNIK